MMKFKSIADGSYRAGADGSSRAGAERAPAAGRRAGTLAAAVLAAAALVLALVPGGPALADRPPAGDLFADAFTWLEPAEPAPNAAFLDADEQRTSLLAFRGRFVLLNFWATWCAPCRREMPALDRLQRILGGPRFEVVALSVDRTGLKAVRPFFEEVGLKTLAVYLDPRGKVQRALAITRFPTTVLIDARGLEVGRIEGPVEWLAPEARALIRFFMEKPR